MTEPKALEPRQLTLADRPRGHTRKPKPPTRWELKLATEEAQMERWLTRLNRANTALQATRAAIKRYKKYVADGKE